MALEIIHSSCAVYDFRANEDYYTVDSLKQWLKANCKKWTFQLEQGDSGYRHWQGRFSLIKKRTKQLTLKLFVSIKPPNYLELTTNKEHQREAFYSMKEDTRIEGPFTDMDEKPEIYIPKQFQKIELYEWQKFIIESKNWPISRQVNLIYDVGGNTGKSTVASIGELMHNGIDMPPLNDFKELIALMCNICMSQNIRAPGLVFIDMPRAMRKDQLFGMYSAIEQIKKGKLYDIRYNYKSWWIDSPQVWVFTNTPPDLTYLSSDRWKIWTLVDKILVPYNPPPTDYGLDA